MAKQQTKLVTEMSNLKLENEKYQQLYDYLDENLKPSTNSTNKLTALNELLNHIESLKSSSSFAADSSSSSSSSTMTDDDEDVNITEKHPSPSTSNTKQILPKRRKILLILPNNILINLIDLLKDDDIKIAAITIKILIKSLPGSLDEEIICDQINEILSTKQTTKTDLIRCRIYEIAIAIGNESSIQQDLVKFIYQRMILDLTSTDVLLQLTILGFLAELAKTDHGIYYLEINNIFQQIMKNIQSLNENPLKNLLIPGYMKFFGNIVSRRPNKMIEYPYVIDNLFNCILDMDETILPVAFDTLGQLCILDEGKIFLDENYKKLELTLNQIGKTINNFPTLLKIRAINCLELLFEINVNNIGPPNNRVSLITNKWYEWLTVDTIALEFLLTFCRNPFPEIKTNSLKLLKAVCGHKWGRLSLINTAGFIEYLLDRKVEFDREALHEKYLLIKLLVDTADDNAAGLDPMTLIALRKYVHEGAFYVAGIMDVATEEMQ